MEDESEAMSLTQAHRHTVLANPEKARRVPLDGLANAIVSRKNSRSEYDDLVLPLMTKQSEKSIHLVRGHQIIFPSIREALRFRLQNARGGMSFFFAARQQSHSLRLKAVAPCRPG